MRWPGRFEWKILGAMALVGILSGGAGIYALQFYLKNFTASALEHQLDMGDALSQAAGVFRSYFDDRKDEFRRRTEQIAGMRPERMGQLAGVSGLLRARLLRAGEVLDQWETDEEMLSRSRPSPPMLAELPLSYGEERPEKILELTFGIPREMYGNFLDLRDAMDREHEVDRVFATVVPRVLKQYSTVVLVVFVVPPLLGFYVARRATRRVQRLRDAAARAGAGDLSVRVNPSGKDELDELGRTFDSMLSELADARSRLEYMQKVSAWQEVARRLAHEIKNPLTPIQLAVQELVSKYRGEDEKYRTLLATADEILAEEIASLRRLVDDFSAFAKLSRAEPVSLDLTGLVTEFVRQHPEFEKWTTVVHRGPALRARCDKVLFRRVLSNLVENAVQAAEGAGRKPEVRISVDALPGGERVVVFVDDNGPGVPTEHRQSIFDPYVTHKEGGTGLGLAIVRKILIDHGGDIRVSGPAPDLGGARFEVRVPTG